MTATDKASPAVASAVKRINDEYKTLRKEQQSLKRGFELQNKELVAGARAIQSVGRITNSMLHVYQTWNIQQLRVSDANRTVRESQESLNRAIADFGPDSEQAIKAAEENARALEDQKRVQESVMVGYGLMATSLIADSSKIVTEVIPKLGALRSALATTGIAGIGMWTAILGPIAAAGAGVVVGEHIDQALRDQGITTPRDIVGDAMGIPRENNIGIIEGLTRLLQGDFSVLNPHREPASSDASPITYMPESTGGSKTNVNTYNFYGYDRDQLLAELQASAEEQSVNQ